MTLRIQPINDDETNNYHDLTDEQFERWKEHFSEEVLVELATFFAVADGFGKSVEVLGLGSIGRDNL